MKTRGMAGHGGPVLPIIAVLGLVCIAAGAAAQPSVEPAGSSQGRESTPAGEPPPALPGAEPQGAAPGLEEAQPAPSLEPAPLPGAQPASVEPAPLPGAQPASAAPAPASRQGFDDEAVPRLRYDGRSEEPQGELWYGWLTLSVDLGSLAMVAVSGGNDSLIAIGLLGFLGATPIVHLVYGQGAAAAISFLVRVGLGVMVVVGVVYCIGDLFDDDDGSSAGCALASVGLIGYPIMSIVDAAVLAYQPAKRRSQAAIRPFFDARRGAGGLLYQASF